FSLAALAKETAILASLALFVWELFAYLIQQRWQRARVGAGALARPSRAELGSRRTEETHWKEFLPPEHRRTFWPHLLLPVVPLAAWYAYHYAKTGFLLALGMRLWQLFGYFGLYLLTLAGGLAKLRPPRRDDGVARPRIPFWMQAAFLSVVLAYLGFMSVVGGAVLARYMLPVVPLVILALVSTLWRRARHWKLIVAAVAIAFAAGLFSNPPYGFSLEDNLAYRDYIVMHAEASRFLAMRYSGERVLTAWPAS